MLNLHMIIWGRQHLLNFILQLLNPNLVLVHFQSHAEHYVICQAIAHVDMTDLTWPLPEIGFPWCATLGNIEACCKQIQASIEICSILLIGYEISVAVVQCTPSVPHYHKLVKYCDWSERALKVFCTVRCYETRFKSKKLILFQWHILCNLCLSNSYIICHQYWHYVPLVWYHWYRHWLLYLSSYQTIWKEEKGVGNLSWITKISNL